MYYQEVDFLGEYYNKVANFWRRHVVLVIQVVFVMYLEIWTLVMFSGLDI